MIYLDSAATTAVRREVLEAMWPFLTSEFGNPSSHHELGEAAQDALDRARADIATVLGCRPSEIIFTSGGTESDNLAIKGTALASPRGRHIVTTAIEHEAVLESCRYLERHHGFEISVVGVNHEGVVSAEDVAKALRPDTTLCTVMLANNEVGSVQPIDQIVRAAAVHGIPVHTDAVQAAGWMSLDVSLLGIDSLSISGHKLGAPKGIGVLYLRGRIPIEPLIHGGGQERGRRSGTGNVAAAVGLALALQLAERGRLDNAERVAELRDHFIDSVLATVPGAVLTGPRSPRLPGSASFCFPGTSGESILLELGRKEIVCSAGSACAVGDDEPSHVLLAMGVDPEVASTAVRFGLDASVSDEDLRRVVTEISAAVGAVKRLGSA